MLEFLASRYLQARTETEELEMRLEALEHEAKIWRQSTSPGPGGSGDEVERVRQTLERSTRVSAERLRALELLVSSFVMEIQEVPPAVSGVAAPPAAPAIPVSRPTSPRPRFPLVSPPGSRRVPPPESDPGVAPEDPVRGSWNRPTE